MSWWTPPPLREVYARWSCCRIELLTAMPENRGRPPRRRPRHGSGRARTAGPETALTPSQTDDGLPRRRRKRLDGHRARQLLRPALRAAPTPSRRRSGCLPAEYADLNRVTRTEDTDRTSRTPGASREGHEDS
ncbi:hypothetical protein LV779_07565 [Streptomyces thinghirensis]|nr:hypothetical protein [Streptomyces thinghirensis]